MGVGPGDPELVTRTAARLIARADFSDACAERLTAHLEAGRDVMVAVTAAVGFGPARHEDVMSVLPSTLPVPELARRLADTQAAVIMELGGGSRLRSVGCQPAAYVPPFQLSAAGARAADSWKRGILPAVGPRPTAANTDGTGPSRS